MDETWWNNARYLEYIEWHLIPSSIDKQKQENESLDACKILCLHAI